ncbi:MAG TPA: DUF1501 domain-containing protein [Gemmataceae bacterium]|jgi:uncharacterized protein (DUF1501 family)|nr:DUF1501 domain-containing protein [Gemmataceae bacterium]
MLSFEAPKGVRQCNGLSRRDFLRVGALTAGAAGFSLADWSRLQGFESGKTDINCILLFLVGGPSQLDTWDPKPGAPANVRGPSRPIATNVPGIQVSEHFPLMAQMADRYAIMRSVHHRAAPIHETGHQLMQTGRLFEGGREFPHYGAVVSHLRGSGIAGTPPFAILPGPISSTGVSVSHGQSAGFLGKEHEPVFPLGESSDPIVRVRGDVDPAQENPHALVRAMDQAQCNLEENAQGSDAQSSLATVFSPHAKKALAATAESESLRSQYGLNTFGQSCLLARRLVEGGVRLVTVNMFDTVFNQITWDCHADGGSLPTTLEDYKETLCPMFDRAYSTLLHDLSERGLLDQTLVVAMGEFGRTPHLNPRGGRDHWPGVWSILFAGAGVRGGQVIGSSDALAAEPKDRPISPQEVAASIYHGLGIDPKTQLTASDGQTIPLVNAEPISELFVG